MLLPHLLWKKLITHLLGLTKLILLYHFLPRNVITGTGKSGQTTIPFPAVMMKLAPKMTTVLGVGVLVHRSNAFIVKIVKMRNVGQNLDIVRFTRTRYEGGVIG